MFQNVCYFYHFCKGSNICLGLFVLRVHILIDSDMVYEIFMSIFQSIRIVYKIFMQSTILGSITL